MPFQSLWHMQIKPNCHHIHAYEQSIHTHVYIKKSLVYIKRHIYIRTYTCSNTVCMHQMHELDTLRKTLFTCAVPVFLASTFQWWFHPAASLLRPRHPDIRGSVLARHQSMGWKPSTMKQWIKTQTTLWLFNVARENHNFWQVKHRKPSIYGPFSIISHAKSPKAKSQSCDQGAQNEGMGPGCRSRLQSSQQIWWARESVPVAWGRNKASEAEMRSAGSYFNLRSASTAFIPKKVQPPGVAHQTECPASSLIDSAPTHVKITSELHLSPKSLRIIELYWADSACSEQSRFCNWVHFSSFLSTYAWTRLARYWEHVAQPMHWDDAMRIFYIHKWLHCSVRSGLRPKIEYSK